MPDTLAAGFTVADLAHRFRVGEDKIRAFIARGELAAINTSSSMSARPRFVVTPDALAEFERRRSASAPPKPRRRRKTTGTDYYPDPQPSDTGKAVRS